LGQIAGIQDVELPAHHRQGSRLLEIPQHPMDRPACEACQLGEVSARQGERPRDA
jgi:hypothetical protein